MKSYAAAQDRVSHHSARKNRAAGDDRIDRLSAAAQLVENKLGGSVRITGCAQRPLAIVEVQRGRHRAQIHVRVVVGVYGSDIAPVRLLREWIAGDAVGLEIVGEHLG